MLHTSKAYARCGDISFYKKIKNKIIKVVGSHRNSLQNWLIDMVKFLCTNLILNEYCMFLIPVHCVYG